MSNSERSARIESKLAQLNAIGEQARALMERIPEGHPLRGVAFQVAALCGEMQATVRGHESARARSTGAQDT